MRREIFFMWDDDDDDDNDDDDDDDLGFVRREFFYVGMMMI